MSIGQVQTRLHSRYDYTRPPILIKHYKPQQNSSPLSTDACMPSTETCPDDLSQDILKEYIIKNQLLTAQVQEYKTLVKHLQNIVEQLAVENKRLNEESESMGVYKDYVQEKQRGQKQILRQTLPLDLITEQTHSSQSIELKQLWNILRQTQFTNIKFSNIQKETLLHELVCSLEKARGLDEFLNGIKQLRRKTGHMSSPEEEGLEQLWSWLVTVATNYRDILQYKKHLASSPPIHRRSRPLY